MDIDDTLDEGLQPKNESLEEYEEYEYDYDLEESFVSFDWAELAPSLVIYSITFIFGVLGNILILAAVARNTHLKHSPVNVFLASLASADLMLILVCLPLKVAKLFSYSWTFGMLTCKILYYLESVSALCSIMNLTALSFERYYAIVHPLKAQYLSTVSKAKKTVGMTWILAFLFGIPVLFIQIHLEVGYRHKAYWCVRDIDNPWRWRFLELYLLFLLLAAPTCIMTFCYGRIIGEIRSMLRQRNRMVFVSSIRKNTSKKMNMKKDDAGKEPAIAFGHEEEETFIAVTEPLQASSRKTTREEEKGQLETIFKEEPSDSPYCLQIQSRFQGKGHLDEKSAKDQAPTSRKHSRNNKKFSTASLKFFKSHILPSNSTDYERRIMKDKRPSEIEAASHSSSLGTEESETTSTKMDEETKQVVYMLILIVSAFILCWGPLLIFNVIHSFGHIGDYIIGLEKHLKTVFSLLSYLNSCLNPIVYGFMSKNFRESYVSDFNFVFACRKNQPINDGMNERNGNGAITSEKLNTRRQSQERRRSTAVVLNFNKKSTRKKNGDETPEPEEIRRGAQQSGEGLRINYSRRK